MALGAGGGRRTASLGAGARRSGSLSSSTARRSSEVSGLTQSTIGLSVGSSVVSGVGDTLLTGDRILQENGDDLLQETGSALLLEDAASAGSVAGIATVSGVGSSLRDAVGTVTGAAATVTGVIEAPGSDDKILLENGDDLLLESGDFLLLEDGSVVPPTALLDIDSFAITDTNGDYILEP